MTAALGGCAGTASTTSRRQRPERVLVALLANRRLVEVGTQSGKVLARGRAGAATPIAAETGSYIAAPPSRSSLFVLAPYAPGKPQEVRELAVSDLAIVRSLGLPAGIVFRSLQASRDGNRLYVVGNRGDPARSGAPVLAVIDTTSGRLLARRTLRPAAGRQWLVFDTALSPDGRLLAVSYHGPDTTGADWVRLRALSDRCPDRTPPGVACLSLHGGVAFRGDDVVATTGEGPLVERTLGDRLVRSWPVKLPRNHLMSFALGAGAARAAVIGGCDYRGGLSVISLATGATTVVGYPEKVCGEKVVFVDGQTLAVARNSFSVPQGEPSRIDLVDVERRRIELRMPTASDVVDVVAVPTRG